MAAHVAPEAVRGGPIGALRDGDQVTIDVDSRRIEVALSGEQIEQRTAEYARRALDADGARANGRVEIAIQKYAKLVGSASEGAIVR
jgi:dihydroxy-acid dehydratase